MNTSISPTNLNSETIHLPKMPSISNTFKTKSVSRIDEDLNNNMKIFRGKIRSNHHAEEYHLLNEKINSPVSSF